MKHQKGNQELIMIYPIFQMIKEEKNMSSVKIIKDDAIEVLMLDEGQTLEMFYEDIKKELKKYSTK